MNRRLLPYEYQLIEALGVSKEEYLEFVALQQEYKDPKAGTALDVRNEAGTVAIVLTVVGILFQVGAALLAPKPSIPDLGADNKRRNRQQRFAPSFGFNGAPELAAYGDPVNLVYTSRKDNAEGGVRVSGSLVWSAVDNFGSAQFMQLLFVLGAAKIKSISEDRTAFGSLALNQLDPSTAFLFYPEDGVGRPPRFKDLIKGKKTFYPESLDRPNNQDVCKIVGYKSGQREGVEGFSQAYSPTTSSSLGIYDPVPIKVEMQTRDSEGEEQFGPIGVTLEVNAWSVKPIYNENDEIQVRFESDGYTGGGDEEVVPLALNFRRQAVNALDFGSTYMLGSAKFRLLSFGSSRDPDDGDVNATFRCIETGRCPSFDYNKEVPVENVKAEKKKLESHFKIINDKYDDTETTPASGSSSFASTAGELDADGNIDDKNIADQYNTKGFINNFSLGHCSITYDFKNPKTASWVNEIGDSKSLDIKTVGSIEYTKYLEDETLNDPPTVNASELRRVLREDIRGLEKTLSDIQGNKYDEDSRPWRGILPATSGRVLDEYGNVVPYDETMSLKYWILNATYADSLIKTPNGRDSQGRETLHYLNGMAEGIKQTMENLRGKIDKDEVDQSAQLKITAFKDDNPGTRGVRTFASYTDVVSDKSLSKRFDRLDEKLARWETKIANRKEVMAGRQRAILVNYLEDVGKDQGFREGDGRYYFQDIEGRKYYNGGLFALEERLDSIPSGKKVPDINSLPVIENKFREIKRSKKGTARDIEVFLQDWDDCLAAADNNFFVKALVKAESAAYETVSEVDQVKFSIKSKLFRRVSGRQLKYGEVKASKSYSLADNGVHGRQAFFRFSYKKADESDSQWKVHPALFAVRQSSESEAYNDFNFYAPSRAKYAFKIDPVYDVASEIALNGQTKFAVLDSHEEKKRKDNSGDAGFVWWNGKEKDSLRDGNNLFPNLEERGPKLTNEWDVFSVNTDTQVQFSFESGPELVLTAVTEQQISSTDGIYKDLSLLSLNMFANRGIQDLRNVTAFVTEGKMSYRVNDLTQPSGRSTSYAPDIFVDTVLDKVNGIGRYAPSTVLDQPSLRLAKNFCNFNNLPTEPDLDSGNSVGSIALHMDGVIADSSSWREFWVNNAPFSLLEFARKNGKETLVPALPTDSAGKAAESDGRPIALTISALFTTGNILEDSYKEEFLDYGASTQDLIASMVYREEYTKSIFQRKRTVEVQLKSGGFFGRTDSDTAIRETFDLSAFVTSRQQAIMFGKMLVNQRRYIRRGVEFKTFPSSNPIEPGAFIYVDIGLNSWDRTSSGVIGAGGALNSPLQDSIPSGTYNFLIYNRDNSAVTAQNSVTVSSGVASSLSGRDGQLYVMGIVSSTKRVFRVTEVEMDEEGEVTVRAIEYPCDDEQRARVADFRPSLFKVS